MVNTPGSINFTEQGGTQKVSFTTNRDWNVSSSESWCKISPSSGVVQEGELSFIVTCDPNTTYDPRNATVTIKADELVETISVTQDTNLGLLVSQTSFSVSSPEQALEVEVKANVNYVVDIPADCKDWISHISTKSLTSRTLVLKISENKAYDDRTGQVTIRQTDGPLAETITINQKQAEGLFITTPEYELSNESQTINVEVRANVQYEVESQVDWIKLIETKALSSSTVVLSIEANNTYDNRTGIVLIKQVNGLLEGRITITQKQRDGLFVSPSSFELNDLEQCFEVEVQSNVDFLVSIPDDAKGWLNLVSSPITKGLSSNKFVFSVSKNTSLENREAHIAFKQVNGPLCEEVIVYQYKPLVDLSHNGHANCYIVHSPGWYSLDAVRGNSDEPIIGVYSVKVIWETFNTITKPSIGSIIKEVKIVDKSVVSFLIPQNYHEGNALIAVSDASGNILWSWHIWVTDYNPDSNYCRYLSGAIMMDRDLGALSAKPEDSFLTNGLLYQWGRKDPFLNYAGCSGPRESHDWFKAKSSTDVENVVETSRTTGTIEYAIQNPSVIIVGKGASEMDWLFYERDNSLWQKNKTKYDPCPVGWRVPSGAEEDSWIDSGANSNSEWAGFPEKVIDQWDEKNMGILFAPPYSTPATWYHINQGAINTYDMNMWTCSTEKRFANYVTFDEWTQRFTWWYFNGNGRYNRFSIRCTKE